jgi:hypothetical protein
MQNVLVAGGFPFPSLETQPQEGNSMMIATLCETTQRRPQRRVKEERPAYLNAELLDRIADNADARLLARVRKQRGE